jgi:hypothetical protein
VDCLPEFLHRLEPSWVAVLIAGVVGGFTIRGVLIAQSTYRNNGWQAKVAQARLVWSEVGPIVGIYAGGKPGDMGERLLAAPHTKLIGSHPGFYEGRDGESGERYTVATRDLTIFRVRITNNSDQPISRCQVALHGSKPMGIVDGQPQKWESPRWEDGPHNMTAKMIRPGQEITIRVLVPMPLAETTLRKTYVTITFTDSAGVRWSRQGALPPKELPKPKPPKFPKVGRWRIAWRCGDDGSDTRCGTRFA